MSLPTWIKEIQNPTVKGNQTIPIYAPLFSGKEKEYLLACVDNTWISPKGAFVSEFEDAFARYCGTRHAVSCASGTAALFLSLVGLDIGPGDEVLVPDCTMISTAFAVTYTGATPVFVDCEPTTGQIDVNAAAQLITKKTRAILPVHLYGTPVDKEPLQNLAKEHHLYSIEDAAEAIGATYRSRRIGSDSDCTTFSLYINKVVTSGQGGMITTNNDDLAGKIRRINNYSFSPQRHFWHEEIGYNLKLTSLQAAIGLAQLEQVERLLAKKKEIARHYARLLTPLSDFLQPLSSPAGSESNHWMIAFVRTSPQPTAQHLRQYLADHGVETRSFFLPLHLQPCYRHLPLRGSFPNSDLLAQRGVLLPSGPGLTEQQIDTVCKHIHRFCDRYARR